MLSYGIEVEARPVLAECPIMFRARRRVEGSV
jgi:hypothetical protein